MPGVHGIADSPRPVTVADRVADCVALQLGCAAEGARVLSYHDPVRPVPSAERADRIHAVPLGPPLDTAAVCGWRYRPGALTLNRDWTTTNPAERCPDCADMLAAPFDTDQR
jgi:hypothetical protein